MEYDPDDEEWSPALTMGSQVNVLLRDYKRYWGLSEHEGRDLSEDELRQFRHLHAIAEALAASLLSLRADSTVVSGVRQFIAGFGIEADVTDDGAARVVRALHSHPIIRDGVKLDLALEAADGLLAGAEKRAADLLALISARDLSVRAAAFLDRASRLYLWGFEPETIVMCASLLEAAYEERFPLEAMIQLQVTRSGREYEPHEYERAAQAAGVFLRGDRDVARQIRQARNDILHNIPDPVLEPLEGLKKTARLLDLLFPSS